MENKNKSSSNKQLIRDLRQGILLWLFRDHVISHRHFYKLPEWHYDNYSYWKDELDTSIQVIIKFIESRDLTFEEDILFRKFLNQYYSRNILK